MENFKYILASSNANSKWTICAQHSISNGYRNKLRANTSFKSGMDQSMLDGTILKSLDANIQNGTPPYHSGAHLLDSLCSSYSQKPSRRIPAASLSGCRRYAARSSAKFSDNCFPFYRVSHCSTKIIRAY